MTKEEFLRGFFSELNNHKLDYFVFGTYKGLPKDTDGSDIDIILNPLDENKFLSIFDDYINSSTAFIASHFGSHLYRIFNNDGINFWGVQIDVFVEGFCHHSVNYFPVSAVKNAVFEYNGIKVLSEGRAFYVDFLKELIHNGKVKEKYIVGFSNLVEENPTLYLNELRKLYGAEFEALIKENFRSRNYPYKELQSLMKKSVHKNNFFVDLKSKIKRFVRLLGKRPGYIIVVEGTDGSGKSTIINAFTPWLNEGFHNGIIYNHLRPNAIPDLGVVLGKKKALKKGDEPKVVSDPHAGNPSGPLGSLIRWLYYMIDYTYGYLKKVWLSIHSKSNVFVFDRYYYDYYVDPYRMSTILPRWLFKIGELFVPSPDLTICLGGDPEKIYARKPETSLEEVTRQTNVLKEFAKTHKNTVWIDTTVAPEESIKATMEAIINMMSKRFAQ